MKKTISELWNICIESAEGTEINNSEMRELEHLMERNREALKETLNENEKELLQKYSACADDYLFTASEQAFCDGFCLGAKLLAEALI